MPDPRNRGPGVLASPRQLAWEAGQRLGCLTEPAVWDTPMPTVLASVPQPIGSSVRAAVG